MRRRCDNTSRQVLLGNVSEHVNCTPFPRPSPCSCNGGTSEMREREMAWRRSGARTGRQPWHDPGPWNSREWNISVRCGSDTHGEETMKQHISFTD